MFDVAIYRFLNRSLVAKHLDGAVRSNQLVEELAIVFQAFDGCVSKLYYFASPRPVVSGL